MHQEHPMESPRADLLPVLDSMERVMVGKSDAVALLFTAILAGGHCLIEDVPGVGKTLLAKAAALTLGCHFQRIQFTPDLLPSDVTGITVYNQDTRLFEFRPGPVFGQVVLADEINRTSPRTQSALLEAMEEGTVTQDGETHRLPQPFFVLATQNPLEFDATFPLPEAQLDRFLMRIRIGYPSETDEIDLLDGRGGAPALTHLAAQASPATVLDWQAGVRTVHVHPEIKSYIVRLVQATRRHPAIRLGASPRAGIGLLAASRAHAYLHGRQFVVPDDVLRMMRPVLGHRIVLQAEARMRGQTVDEVLADMMADAAVPGVSMPEASLP